jgi:tRNA-modifying protein YgfZ
MPQVHLHDRGVVAVSGPDATGFLDGLVTCDIDKVRPDAPRFGALLSPQGKILFDFLVNRRESEGGDVFLLDLARVYAPDLVKRLSLYRLRAKVTVEDRSDAHAVHAGWDSAPPQGGAPDPRLARLGWRAILPAEAVGSDIPGADAGPDAYHARRIALGVPEGGRDFLFGDAFPHEALMDQLHGVDFDKGCYVGQEVVSRMQHRGTARSRILPLTYVEGFVAEAGVEVVAGDRPLGRTGTALAGRGLALLRLDRVAEARAASLPIRAGGLEVTVDLPAFAAFGWPE